MARILMLCDWLPPEFGAVGQYAVGFAGELASAGHAVTLVGLSSTEASEVGTAEGEGRLVVRRILQPLEGRRDFVTRTFWMARANLALLWGSRSEFRTADEVRFTGSPAYMLHFVMPVATAFRLRTRYRITDFHPEWLIATLGHTPWWLRPLAALTRFWRRRVDVIEVLGEDQRRRLAESGVDPARIELRRDPSPIRIVPGIRAATPPRELAGRRIVLYSGSWGIPHDHRTFLDGYAQFCRSHPAVSGVWLNAAGHRADAVAREMALRNLPCARTHLVPLAELPAVLAAADVHLITLSDAFVGYALPSKVHGCIESGKPILFIGSAQSDVHLACAERVPATAYRRVDVGDVAGVASALQDLLVDRR
jgi:glycosyltransferase involved in cell wall biosynthesis